MPESFAEQRNVGEPDVLIADTDILIDIQRRIPGAVSWSRSLPDALTVAGFTAMEVVQGARDTQEVKLAVEIIAPLTVVWPSKTDCERARKLFLSFHLSHRIGLIDALIAATAMGLDAELATFNVKHFRAVQGLKLVQPYTR